jgi:hypothetical protein
MKNVKKFVSDSVSRWLKGCVSKMRFACAACAAFCARLVDRSLTSAEMGVDKMQNVQLKDEY